MTLLLTCLSTALLPMLPRNDTGDTSGGGPTSVHRARTAAGYGRPAVSRLTVAARRSLVAARPKAPKVKGLTAARLRRLARRAGVRRSRLLARVTIPGGLLAALVVRPKRGRDLHLVVLTVSGGGMRARAATIYPLLPRGTRLTAQFAPIHRPAGLWMLTSRSEKGGAGRRYRMSEMNFVLRAKGGNVESACRLAGAFKSSPGRRCGFHGRRSFSWRVVSQTSTGVRLAVSSRRHGYNTCRRGMPSHGRRREVFDIGAKGGCKRAR